MDIVTIYGLIRIKKETRVSGGGCQVSAVEAEGEGGDHFLL